MGESKLRFALCGTGNFGTRLTSYLNEVAEVAAVADPDGPSRAQYMQSTRLRVPQFDHLESLLAEVDVDAVAIVSPNNTHKEIAITAARAGKHVFCEKAMATNVPDCWEMVRATEAAGVRLMVGQKRRLRPAWVRMISLPERLGEAIAITVALYCDARPYDFKGWWTRRAQSGGLLNIFGVHTIDWMRAMCGAVTEVRAVAGQAVDARYEFPETMHVSLGFQSGAVASLNVSLAYPLSKFREAVGAQIVCRNGGILLETFEDHLDLYWQHRSDPERSHERFTDLGFDAAYRRELGDFVRWVTEGTPPCLTWREGLRCVEVMEAAHLSADEGGRIVALPLYPELEP
jgi:predicted dehydrogenase